ncbi:neuropeptide-like 1 isoform X2 [Tribolium castaneum]|uniref:neuropeptide-like 1 isoform X2 n=1 Tax=Tribolium castaneum TaxID=7070 RepID=UPI00077DCB2D|nr:PREDICTED: neuropeptide-like 1 isoform X2 [Tribolium castaneum]|eukprot:XP_015838526.1 PREDICTED: neuropeptide-like 1 isoform X2 [Tribolium castaneum]
MLFGAPKFFFGTGVLVFALIFVVKSDESCDIEIENTLKTLLTPQDYPSMQQQALRKDLLRRFQQALDRADDEDEMNYKRSISSLAQWGNLPGKRNLEALARAGYIRTLPNPDEEDPNNKRSLSTLAKNDQLPTTFQNNESKRGIESLARNGELHNRRDIQELLDELYNKRNVGSLARNFNFPSYGKRYLASLVRNGELNGKRNIASIKAQYPGTRSKRQASYYDGEGGEFSLPVYQNQNVDDYEELVKALAAAYPNNDKRFLGSVARSGWFRPNSRYRSPEKRHIGALARLGWLPTLRNVRRFNRSGRSTTLEGCREAATDGQTEDDAFAEDQISLEDKRFLLQPAVDQILLRKIFMHPRTHPAIN